MSKVFDSAIRIVSFGPQFKSMLKLKLISKGYENEEIAEVIDKLEELEYLNDYETAKLYARTLLVSKLYGPIMIQSKLFAKSVDRNTISEVIEIVLDEAGGELEICRKYFEKIKKNENDPIKLQRKLSSRGFSIRVIKQTLSRTEVEDDI